MISRVCQLDTENGKKENKNFFKNILINDEAHSHLGVGG